MAPPKKPLVALSRWQLKRRLKLIKNKKIIRPNSFENVSDEPQPNKTQFTNYFEKESLTNVDQFFDETDSASHSHIELDKDEILKNDITLLVIEKNITRDVTDSLLKILIKYGCKLPRSHKTLMEHQTCDLNEAMTIRALAQGQYLHIGIENNLTKFDDKTLMETDAISIDIGIDGVPLFKSSSEALWPILGCISHRHDLMPFIIGVFCGVGHPKCVDSFLHEFVNEATELTKNGILVTRHKIRKPFSVRLFICDTPAKSFIVGSKHHTALNGCHKCQQVGQRVKNRSVYQTEMGILRTDENFAARDDIKHHNVMNPGYKKYFGDQQLWYGVNVPIR